MTVTRATLALLLVLAVSAPLRAQSNAASQAAQQGWQALQAGDAERAAALFHHAVARDAEAGIDAEDADRVRQLNTAVV